jgi:hypothetical protein
MTEEEWLGWSGISDKMLNFLRGRPGLGRKRRLLAVACCRHVLQWMPDECLPAIPMAERLAEERVDEEARWVVYNAVGDAKDEQVDIRKSWAAYCAYNALGRPLDYEQPASWNKDCAAWVAQTAAQPDAWINNHWDNDVLFAERHKIANLIRDVFGNPFRPLSMNPAWLTSTVTNLATIAYDERALPIGELDTTRLAVLADALEDSGCDHHDILGHLRGPGPHVRGCWVVDLLLGKS